MSQRRIILYVACSADGYIAGPNDELDWLFHDQDYGYAAFLEGVDTVLVGRRTHDVTRSFAGDDNPYEGRRVIVFSSSRGGEHDSYAEFTDRSPADVIAELRGAPGKDIWLIGGGELVREFLMHDLIDEFVIFAHPVLLGDGISLFPPGFPKRGLRFVAAESYDTGMLQMTYERDRE